VTVAVAGDKLVNVAVIVAVPAAIPETMPVLEFTLAIVGSEELQLTSEVSVDVVLPLMPTADRLTIVFTPMAMLAGVTLILVGAMTVMLNGGELIAPIVAVIVVVPRPAPLNAPVPATVIIEPELQLTCAVIFAVELSE
jgi:hypothetical protein